ncbi:MAG: C39 family peptidase [Candidatus Zixiibacteriota bacterium]
MRGLKTTAHLLLFCLIAAPVWSQQSNSGPHRPEGADLGLRAPSPGQVVIDGVPAYLWRHGCGPTAAGMVIGYWDSQGYPDLVEGDAFTQTAAVHAMIADDGGDPTCDTGELNHYQDYACPVEWSWALTQPDKSELGGEVHPDNCLADFMLTSRSAVDNNYGWTWFIHVAQAFHGYVGLKYPGVEVKSENIRFADFSWEQYKEEIDNNRPVVLLVDSYAHSNSDHFVTGIGYDEETMEFAIYDEYDTDIHWYAWHENAPGWDYGIYGITTFSLPVEKGHQASGDFDCSGALDDADIVALTNYLFNNGPCSECPRSADVSGDGVVDTDDLIALLTR